jgi:hypothetical protein
MLIFKKTESKRTKNKKKIIIIQINMGNVIGADGKPPAGA